MTKILRLVRKYGVLVSIIMAALNLAILIAGGGILAWVEWYKFGSPQDDYILRKSKIEADAVEQKPTDDNYDLNVTELKKFSDGSSLYDVKFDVISKNLSELQITLSYSVAELYVGNINIADLKLNEAATLNGPPDPWHTGQGRPIKWSKIKYDVAIADGNKDEKVLDWLHQRYDLITNDGLAAILPSKTQTEYEPEFLVRAKPDQYVAVVFSYGINNSTDINGPDVIVLYETLLLKDADRGSNATKFKHNAIVIDKENE